MLKVVLKHSTDEGSQEIPLEGEKTSFGRGSEADYRFEDDGLSRLHATVYRDGTRIWIVDENSTNGSFVNGEKVSGSGTPLVNGDTVKIGHYTKLKVGITEEKASAPVVSSQSKTVAASGSSENTFGIMPLVITACAIFVIGAAAIFIGVKVLGGGDEIVYNPGDGFETPRKTPDDENNTKKSPTPKTENSKPSGTNENTNIQILPIDETNKTTINLPSGKKYTEMSDEEKRQYIEVKAEKVARMIGNRSSETIPPAAVGKIKSFADAYATRINAKSQSGSCRFGDNLQSTYERASRNAPFIIKAFYEQGIDPQIGLYLAMIESEHCVCLQSPTGPLGMFQFTFATAKLHFQPPDGVIKGASISNPDDRCKPEPAAFAASRYMKALTARYGTGPLSVPLAIGSYNSGEGGLSKNLKTALEASGSQERSFWTLIANSEKLSKQFQMENIKYVPKFFAAAIIGENPQDFGMNLQPLSLYTK
ncbi:MAG: FHA domain-containing protein [Pyrinomonadaceae bacterium]